MNDHPETGPGSVVKDPAVQLIIKPKQKDLGEFTVRRVLPSASRQMVGPFIFFDHMGPAEFPPGQGVQVRPHPHIGIATVTYLFEGEIIHRDSLGVTQPIQPGAVNLMTAGSGIVHSERSGDDLDTLSRLHGIQSWLALPDGEQECAPAFAHVAASDLPTFEIDGVRIDVIVGEVCGHTSPVDVHSPTLYLQCKFLNGSSLSLSPSYQELAVYVVSGSVRIGQQHLDAGVMAVLADSTTLQLEAQANSHIMVVGGDPLGERHIWWNFAASTKQRIEQAKADWKAGRFAAVPGETEFIPLPE